MKQQASQENLWEQSDVGDAVRLKMHGEIKLGGWHAFRAGQVIRRGRGMIWQASTRLYGLPVSGSDRYLDGEGSMQWKLFGIVPLVNASGPDISLSGAGRFHIESVWLPSMRADISDVDYTFDAGGGLQSLSMLRWGNPGDGPFRYEKFGAFVDDEGTFGGYTIPIRLRVGWYFGTERFAKEGEFFRVTIDDAKYR
jgi:hypothetical protein